MLHPENKNCIFRVLLVIKVNLKKVCFFPKTGEIVLRLMFVGQKERYEIEVDHHVNVGEVGLNHYINILYMSL